MAADMDSGPHYSPMHREPLRATEMCVHLHASANLTELIM